MSLKLQLGPEEATAIQKLIKSIKVPEEVFWYIRDSTHQIKLEDWIYSNTSLITSQTYSTFKLTGAAFEQLFNTAAKHMQFSFEDHAITRLDIQTKVLASVATTALPPTELVGLQHLPRTWAPQTFKYSAKDLIHTLKIVNEIANNKVFNYVLCAVQASQLVWWSTNGKIVHQQNSPLFCSVLDYEFYHKFSKLDELKKVLTNFKLDTCYCKPDNTCTSIFFYLDADGADSTIKIALTTPNQYEHYNIFAFKNTKKIELAKIKAEKILSTNWNEKDILQIELNENESVIKLKTESINYVWEAKIYRKDFFCCVGAAFKSMAKTEIEEENEITISRQQVDLGFDIDEATILLEYNTNRLSFAEVYLDKQG